jgi:hypothetical protein
VDPDYVLHQQPVPRPTVEAALVGVQAMYRSTAQPKTDR